MESMTRERVSALLPLVSRTFALSIRLLGEPLRHRVGLAYLVCRLLDTFEDDPKLPQEDKILGLNSIADFLEGGAIPDLLPFSSKLTAPEAEITLVEESASLLKAIQTLPQEAAAPIRRWAAEMGRGMNGFSKRAEIRTLEELEKYCYYVAGTVGMMLTGLFAQKYGFSIKRIEKLERYAVNFGLCLQFVNILKDSGPDFREGRCFIPSEMIAELKISKEDFFAGRDRTAASIVYGKLLRRADDFIRDAESYIKALPIRCYSIRRFCILPLLLAKKTLRLLHSRKEELPVQTDSPKITRKDVRRSVLASYPAGCSNTFFRML